MKKQYGWGNKTAALFTKTIYHLHNNDYPESLRIWDDVPNNLDNGDRLYLPVDAVILSIFNKIDDLKWNFNSINSLLEDNNNPYKIEVWDDLWFWGFITQEGRGIDRKFGWNLNKYYMLKESDKNMKVIKEIELKAKQFLEILGD